MRKRTLIGLIMALALIAAACSSSDSGDDTATDGGTESTDGENDGDTGDGGGDGDCPSDLFTGTITQQADDEGNPAVDLSGTDIVLAEAFELSAGSSYTVYLADYDLGGQDIGSDTIEADAGQVVVTINPKNPDGGQLEAGASYDMAFAIIDSGGGASSTSSNIDGTITVIDATADQICFDVDYSDDTSAVTGTVSAEIVAGF